MRRGEGRIGEERGGGRIVRILQWGNGPVHKITSP